MAFALGILLTGVAIGRAMAGQQTDSVPATQSRETPGTLASEPATVQTPSTSAPAQATGGVDQLLAGLAAIDLDGIEFLPGTAVVTPNGEQVLLRAATAFIANPALPVEIVVHTYTESTPGINHGLSTEQADAVFGFLVASGVDENRLATTGVGSQAAGSSNTGTVLLFETSHRDFSSALDNLGALALELPPGEALSDSNLAVLEQVAAELAAFLEAELTLVAYAYDQDSVNGNHERSHELADEAVAHLVGGGVDPGRLASVGLGDAPLNLDLDTVVEFEVGPTAALTLGIRRIDNEAIDFEPQTATLTPGGRRTLDELTAALSVDPTKNIEVAAHSYSEETSEANHDLSHQQGESVVRHLVNGGIDPSRLLLSGHGDPPQFFQPGRDSFITFTVVR